MAYCPQCGALVTKEDATCPSCGRVLSENYSFNSHPMPPQGGSNNAIFAIVGGVVAVAIIAVLGFVAYGYFTSKDKEREIELLEQQAFEAKEESEKLKDEATQAKIDKMNQEINQLRANQKVVSGGKGKISSVPPSEASRCVINGTGVRMRFGPGLQYNYLVDRSGFAYTVRKGTPLPFLGQEGNWYRVRFEGGIYYVSADYAYLIR